MIENTYAEALFKLAMKENSLQSMIEQFENFNDIAIDHPDWIVLLDTSSIRNKNKRQMLEELGVFDKAFVNFLMILIRNHDIKYYQDIYEQWIILSRREQKIAFVHLYTSKKLSSKQIERLRQEVQAFIPNMTIEFRIQIDSSLIEGIRMTYQGRSIERSLKRTIDDMKSNI